MVFMVQRSHGLHGAALPHDFVYTAFAVAALGGNPEFKLDFIEIHACMCMANDFTIGNTVAYTNNHWRGSIRGWLVDNRWIINTNFSY